MFVCFFFRYLYGDGEEEDGENGQQLSDQCADEVERVLEQRAISVNLHPEIEDACRGELTTKCGPATGDGEELKCLQDNLNSLGPECSNAVRTYTEMEAKNAVLNPVIAAACHGIIDQHCQEEVSHKDEGTVIQCLIKFRDDHEADGGMDDKCSAAVEHWQILSMNDYKFSFKFKDACKHDIRKECAKFEPKTKADVVGCLSTIARDDVIQDRNPKTLSKQCRVQLKFQLLQKHSNIKLNDKIVSSFNFLNDKSKTTVHAYLSVAFNFRHFL
jgi:Golgi apparatus protein 1